MTTVGAGTNGAGTSGVGGVGGGVFSPGVLLRKLLATKTDAVAGASISIQSPTVRSSLTAVPLLKRARMLKFSPGPERTLRRLEVMALVAGSMKPA